MKVIFLDIDGVMNSEVFYRERHRKKQLNPLNHWWRVKSFFRKLFKIQPKPYKYKESTKAYTFKYQFERLREETCSQKWKWLSEWCNENDIKICVSSVWRNHFYDKHNDRYRGRPEWWEDAFINLGFKPGTFVGITSNKETLRGEEIQEWLDNTPEIEDYAILDDDSDMMDHQFKKFHHCDSYFGLSPNHLYRISRQFEGKSDYSNLSEVLK